MEMNKYQNDLKEARSASRSAAWSAIDSARSAYSAESAAGSASESAAWSAARSSRSAGSAARSAGSAARSAESSIDYCIDQTLEQL